MLERIGYMLVSHIDELFSPIKRTYSKRQYKRCSKGYGVHVHILNLECASYIINFIKKNLYTLLTVQN
jgi:hypothetical protein